MALNAIIDNLDSVPEYLKAEYKEITTDGPNKGHFALDLHDDVKVHPKIVPLSNTVKALRVEKKTAEEALAAANEKLVGLPEDFSADEYIALKANAPDPNDPNKKPGNDEHLQSQKKVYEQRIAAIEKKRDADLAAREGVIQELEGFTSNLVVDEGLTKALVEAGVAKEYLKAARAMLKPSVKILKDGTHRMAIVETDLGELDLPKFVTSWVQSDEGKVFVAKATGGDATGGTGRVTGENPWAKDQFNRTKQDLMFRDNPAKARQLAQAAGVKPDW